MLDQRGGILFKLFIIPAAVVLMGGIFFLGYYLGRHQGKSDSQNADLQPLPEIPAQNLPKPEDYTFYKTLTAKEDKTVSIDLHPRPASATGAAGKKQADAPTKETASQAPKETEAAMRNEKKTAAKQPTGLNTVNKTSEPQKKESQVKQEKKEGQTKQEKRESPAKQEKKESPAKQTASLQQRYSVQISSHREKQTADLEMKKMKRHGFAAFIVSSEVPGKGSLYRVRIGSYTSKAAAEKMQKEVRAKAGVASVVVEE
jgi:DedD protein